MEQAEGLGGWVRGVAEVVNVAVQAQTADDGGAGWGGHGVKLSTDWNLAVVAHAHGRALAPDEGPPRAGGRRAQDGAVFPYRLVPGGLGRGAKFPLDLVGVGVGQEQVEQVVSPFQCEDFIGRQKGRAAFLPVVVAAFDFAFGLRGGGEAQGHAVEVEGGSELGEGGWGVGVEEGVEVHIKGQGQAVGLEDAGKEVEMGQEGFAGVKPCAGVEPGGVVEDFQEDLFVRTAGQPSVRGGIVLPEGPVITGLPAFDGFGGGFVAGVWRELMFDGPAPDAGAVGFEVEPALGFTGGGAVGGRGLGGEQFGDQGGDFRGPFRLVIAARQTGRPGFGVSLRAGEQVVRAQLVEATEADPQFERDGCRRKAAGASLGKEMADQWRGNTMGELEFFMARKLAGRWI